MPPFRIRFDFSSPWVKAAARLGFLASAALTLGMVLYALVALVEIAFEFATMTGAAQGIPEWLNRKALVWPVWLTLTLAAVAMVGWACVAAGARSRTEVEYAGRLMGPFFLGTTLIPLWMGMFWGATTGVVLHWRENVYFNNAIFAFPVGLVVFCVGAVIIIQRWKAQQAERIRDLAR